LKKIRSAIKATALAVKEGISYGMPHYSYHGRLSHFAAFKDHVGYFAMPGHSIQKTFARQFKPYQTEKSTLQFPLGTAVPVALLRKIVKARIKENQEEKVKYLKIFSYLGRFFVIIKYALVWYLKL